MCEQEAPAYIVENMTITARLTSGVDLDEIAASFHEATFDPEKIMRVDFRVRDPKVTVGIFRNGKLVCLGAKSFEDGKRGIHRVVELFQEHHNLGMVGLKAEPQVKNVVASMRTGLALDLESLCSQFEIANYDPVEYSGLVVRLDGSATATLFASGTIMFTGVKSEEQMREFVSIVWEKIRLLSAGANIVESEQNYNGR